MNCKLSNEYLMAKALYLENELKKLPNVTVGKHRGIDVVYICDNQKNRKRYRMTSKKGISLFQSSKLKEKLLKELETVYSDNNKLRQLSNIKIRIPKLLPYSIKTQLQPDSNPKDKFGNYWFKNIQMRSRLEILTAEVLDSLGLEFMYEASIMINGHQYSPDFIVFLPELGCCFIIECLGKTDDISYLYQNNNKLLDYLNIGFELNMNLLLFCGTVDSVPDPNNMRADIIHLINNLARNLVIHS